MKLVPWTTVLKIKFSASVSYIGYHVAIEIGKSVYYAPAPRAPNRRGIKWWCCLSVCLSRTSGQRREQRGLGRPNLAQRYYPRHTWLGHHFQGQKIKGQGHQAALLTAVGASGGCSGGRVNVLAVGNCYYVAVCSAAQGAHGGEGRGISWPPACSMLLLLF